MCTAQSSHRCSSGVISAFNIPLSEPRRVTILHMSVRKNSAASRSLVPSPDARRRSPAPRLARGLAVAGVAAAAYMAFESQWVRCRQVDLPVPGLPAAWSGVTVLHLSDVHAGLFSTNERSLTKAVRWAEPLAPDLVFLTGDILGDPERSRPCLDLLAQLRPPLGMFAVTGNHEYGLSKAPLARPRDTSHLWEGAGITLLSDSCVGLPPRQGSEVVLCGADYASGGYGLLNAERSTAGVFPILLIHEPPPSESPLATLFPLAFAGHTHGGQLRLPAPSGLTPFNKEGTEYLAGINRWGPGLLVVSRGIGTSFVPLRLFTRPEATLWRLVYTSLGYPEMADR
jgi:predicted MPP superfamily phosphohydrolase